MKAEELLFRTHNFGVLCTGAQGKPDVLGDTAKTLVENIFREVVRGTYKQNLSNMYTRKGHSCESLAIARIARVNGWGVMLNANTQMVELSDSIGVFHPDAYNPKKRIGFDAKCSFTDETFPMFKAELKDKNYEWQSKRAQMITGFDSWPICYSLENSPEEIVISHAWKLWLEGYNEGAPTGDFIDDVRALHIFDHLPDWARVKTFDVKLEEKDVTYAHQRAELGRSHFQWCLDEYEKLIKNKQF